MALSRSCGELTVLRIVRHIRLHSLEEGRGNARFWTKSEAFVVGPESWSLRITWTSTALSHMKGSTTHPTAGAFAVVT